MAPLDSQPDRKSDTAPAPTPLQLDSSPPPPPGYCKAYYGHGSQRGAARDEVGELPLQDANTLSNKVYDECFRGQFKENGYPRHLTAPALVTPGAFNHPGQIETVTRTTGLQTGDSRELDVYMHARDKVKQVVSGEGKGTGFFVSDDGLMVTDYHVHENDKQPKVIINGEKRDATVVAPRLTQDLTLLKVEPRPGENFGHLDLRLQQLPGAKPGVMTDESFNLRQRLVGIGYAWGQSTLTMSPVRYAGMIKQSEIGLDKPHPYVNQDRTEFKVEGVVAPGQSGGPVLDLSGRVRGVIDYANADQVGIFTPASRIADAIEAYRRSLQPKDKP